MLIPRGLIIGVSLALATVAGGVVRAAEFSNPIISGDWSDPGVIKVGDDFYSCRSSFGWQPGIPIVHSRDLVNWEYIGHAFDAMPGIAPGDTRNGIWGVEMGYNPNTRQFLIYAPMRNYDVYVFSADKPEGPYAMKKLGSQLGIDPGFFADDNGKLYLVLNKGPIYELSSDGLSIRGPAAEIDRKKYRYFEGPDIFKRNGWYYLLFSDGGTLPHEPSTISTLRSRSIAGPWEEDPNNPNMFATDSGSQFEAPAHGTLLETKLGEWYLAYHAHETAYYTLGREMLMQPVEWTADGWWRPSTGKVPTATALAPSLIPAPLRLAQSDEFDRSTLGLQWFFTCPPDRTGQSWSLTEKPGVLRIHAAKGDLAEIDALPVTFQQRVVDKTFTVETQVTFDARSGHEMAGLHFFHDPAMNFWLGSSVRDGKKMITVGKTTLGQRTDLWSEPNPYGASLQLRIVVDGAERATFFHRAGDGSGEWRPIGNSIYFGASGHHLRNGQRGDPDLGWVGRYKEKNAPAEPKISRLPDRRGNIWTAATFGVFAVRDGATESHPADFEYVRVTPTR